MNKKIDEDDIRKKISDHNYNLTSSSKEKYEQHAWKTQQEKRSQQCNNGNPIAAYVVDGCLLCCFH